MNNHQLSLRDTVTAIEIKNTKNPDQRDIVYLKTFVFKEKGKFTKNTDL